MATTETTETTETEQTMTEEDKQAVVELTEIIRKAERRAAEIIRDACAKLVRDLSGTLSPEAMARYIEKLPMPGDPKRTETERRALIHEALGGSDPRKA